MNYLAIIWLVSVVAASLLMTVAHLNYKKDSKDILYTWIFALSLNITLWLFCNLLIQLAPSDFWILFFHELKFLFILSISPVFLILVLYMVTGKRPSRLYRYGFISIALVIFGLIMTNSLHHLFRITMTIYHEEVIIVRTQNGPLFWFNTVYTYVLAFTAILLLLVNSRKQAKIYRIRERMLLFSFMLPLIFNALFVFFASYIGLRIDYTPLTFFVSIGIFLFAYKYYVPNKIKIYAREMMVQHIQSATLMLDRDLMILEANPQFLYLMRGSDTLLPRGTIHHLEDPVFKVIRQTIDAGFETRECKLGDIDYMMAYTPVKDELNVIIAHIIMLTDISKIQKLVRELAYNNEHDALTGAYNRTYFNKVIRVYDQPAYFPLGIITGDLNGLKRINDLYGHQAGDELLIKASDNLRAIVGERGEVCRIGGDEFIIIVSKVTENELKTIIAEINKRCCQMNSDLETVHISLGYALKYDHNISIDALTTLSDESMYRNKILVGQSSRDNNLTLLTKILAGKNVETKAHLERTTQLARIFGEKLNLSLRQQNDLILLAKLHDIGKTVMPDEILFKKGPLSDEEWVIMKTHSERGYDILTASPNLSEIANCVRYHHEKFDGTGYPEGLKGEEIPYLSRIISIIDAYDVMRHKRAYKDAYTKKTAILELEACKGTQFDPQLTNAFIELLSTHKGL